ncbi:hypothetical protein R3P38DRAFT_3532470 [Favolaschia claudopus]|uniref:DUF6535 domain-containing protein n=1 Tax=Favolaschia claudopus TaxID=2862362 RepID=A0AAW0BE77_9AGAR
MVDLENGRIPPGNPTSTDSSDDADGAAARVWAVYVSEAEKYDKALVESWKSDMEGLLIFAGLFSASLTAFIIESYRALNPDSGDLTVELLGQISLQLAASANGSTFQLPSSPPPPFTPPLTSLICNGFWFISLGLSLSCALIATFVQQWAREFLHKADVHCAPLVRARIFSFLYYGLKRFKMHIVVEIIPLLLHLALFSFFAGLVAFLIPVSTGMTAIAVTLLGLIGSIYCVLSLLPLLYLDSPYRTPLSGSFWQISQAIGRRRQRRKAQMPDEADLSVLRSPPSPKSMAEAITRTAVSPSDERSERDQKALVWTMKSLVDDTQMEPFIEAIPDLLWGPRERRQAYQGHIRRLVQNQDVQFTARIASLLNSCDTGILSREARIQRRIICYKAVWAVASLARPNRFPTEPNHNFGVDFSAFSPMYGGHLDDHFWVKEIAPYVVSAKAMMLWSTFCAWQGRLISLSNLIWAGDALLDDRHAMNKAAAGVHVVSKFFAAKGLIRHVPPVASISALHDVVKEILQLIPYKIMFELLATSLRLDTAPYRWSETKQSILVDSPTSNLRPELELCLSDIIPRRMDRMNAFATFTWLDDTVAQLVSYWRPTSAVHIPYPVIHYINHRQSASAVKNVLERGKSELYLWANFPITLSSESPTRINMASQEALLTALWRVAFLGTNLLNVENQSLHILDVLSGVEPPLSGIAHSITALIKHRILYRMPQNLLSFNNRILPAETAFPISDDDLVEDVSEYVSSMMRARKQEARIHVLAEFLQFCRSDALPYMAVETLEAISRHAVAREGVHRSHQLSLAQSVHDIFTTERFPELLPIIINFECWTLYAKQPKFDNFGEKPWLSEGEARQRIKTSFGNYATRRGPMVASGDPVLVWVNKILKGFDAWHAI